MSDGLRLVPEGDETAADAQIPFNWIPPPLLTVVNQLMERYAKPAASAGLLGLRERSVQVARAATAAGSLHNATFA